MKKFGIMMNICMGATISFFLSLVNMLASGHFAVPGFIISFIISTIISIIIGFIVPIPKVESKFFTKHGIEPHSLKARLTGSCLSDFIYTPIMSLVMVLFARNSIVRSGAPAAAIPPLVPMYLKSLILSLVVCYIIVFIVQPIFVKALMKKFGVPGGAPMGEKPEQ
ncbi:MAG: hypothetical protein J6L99_00895 [Ruminococcus sp.]|nr:hypothetical protein [Ruminococcus sp.]